MSRPRRARPAILAGLLVALIVGIFGAAGEAGAQSSSGLFIRKIDSSDPKNIKIDFVWTGTQGELSGLKLSQNGTDTALKGGATPLKPRTGTVIVIDSGRAGMDKDNALVSARDAAKKLVSDHLTANSDAMFAVVQAGDQADLKLDFSNNLGNLQRAIDGVGPSRGSAVWPALKLGGETLKLNRQLQPNILLIVGNPDTSKVGDDAVGRTAVLSSGAAVWAVERLGFMDPAPYSALVAKAGGQVLATDQGPKLGEQVDAAGKSILDKQYQVSYDSGLTRSNVADLSLSIGDQSSKANILPGGVYQGSESLRPELASRGVSFPLLENKAVFILALVLVLLAAAGAAYALTSLMVRDDLSYALQPYADAYGGDLEEDNGSYAKSALIQRAVALTEQVAQNQGLLVRAEASLERANLPLRAGEGLFFYVVIVIVVTLLSLILTKNLMAGVMFGILGAIIPVATVNYLGRRRRKVFMSQLPDTLSLLSGTLRAGYSLMQGVEAVSQEVTEPMGLELRRVITEARLGRPLEESLDASADRMDSPDFAWAVMAIRIQREVGGNLSELLMTVADTMIQRERLRRDVAALTAEGRVSAIVLAGLPPGLGFIMWLLNPEYVQTLFTDGLGIGMLIAAGISMGIGFLWMRKIINIEI